MSKAKTKAKGDGSGCQCLALVSKELDKQGVELETGFAIDLYSGEVKTTGPFLSVRWKESPKPRGKKLPKLVCAYCPICGRKAQTEENTQ